MSAPCVRYIQTTTKALPKGPMRLATLTQSLSDQLGIGPRGSASLRTFSNIPGLHSFVRNGKMGTDVQLKQFCFDRLTDRKAF